jgi:hypothetical protein
VKRPGAITLAGVVAALLGNYWVVAGFLAKRSDLSGSWISDLAARSEAFGWRFELLETVSGLAVVVFALLLLPRLGERSTMIRAGLVALIAEGVLTVIGAAAPLSCAESLDPSCSLRYDAVDVIHATAELASVAAMVLAFVLIGVGLTRLTPRRADGNVTLTIGAVWLLLTAATALSYLGGDIDSVKGLLQRGSQLLFGAWLILLGIWTERLTTPARN